MFEWVVASAAYCYDLPWRLPVVRCIKYNYFDLLNVLNNFS